MREFVITGMLLSLAGCPKSGAVPVAEGAGGGGATSAGGNEFAKTPRDRKIVSEAEAEFAGQFASLRSPCGTSLELAVDWSTFDFAAWHAAMDARQTMAASTVPGLCMYEVLTDALPALCKIEPSLRPELAKLTKVSCTLKPCAELPRSVPNQTEPDPGATLGYFVKDEGRTLEVQFCDNVSVAGSYDARYFIKKAYGL